MIRFLIAFMLFLLVPLFVGCAITIDPETVMNPPPIEVVELYSDMETCMFTVWYGTQPNAPPIEDVVVKCEDMLEFRNEIEDDTVIKEIREALNDRPEVVEPVDCTNRNCI